MSAVTETAPRWYTAADLEELSARGLHYELYFGELQEMPLAGGDHGSVGQRLGARASGFVDGRQRGESFLAETGFKLTSDPDTVLAPDWAYISAERLPESFPPGFLPVVPDIVVEVRSPSETPREFSGKIALWLQLGVRLAWALDPVRRTVVVHRPGTDPRILQVGDVLDGEEVLPGFTVEVAKLFRA